MFTVKKESLEVMQERVFNASPEDIWNLITNPATVPQWWGPKKYSTRVDKMDFRVGGEWRYVQKDEQGNEFGFNGVYKEIIPFVKISDTFNFEPIPGDHELVETLTLEDLGNGTTKMLSITKYKNIEDLEGMVNSGMEGGATETWDRIAEIVERA